MRENNAYFPFKSTDANSKVHWHIDSSDWMRESRLLIEPFPKEKEPENPDISIGQLIRLGKNFQGPDFPSGGEMISSEEEIKNIYNKFEKSLNIDKNFIVAVSGGPDSLTLAFLAKIYSIKKKLVSKILTPETLDSFQKTGISTIFIFNLCAKNNISASKKNS